MDKYDLLKRVGFSDEYISHLKSLEDNERYVFESVVDEYKPLSSDVSNVIVDESANSFTTRLMLRLK
jgi:hypothetical protein